MKFIIDLDSGEATADELIAGIQEALQHSLHMPNGDLLYMNSSPNVEIAPDDDPIDVRVAGDVIQDVCHAAAKNAGWWLTNDGKRVQDNPYAFSNKLALIHSEVSEAMEGDRKSLMDDHLPHRPMREVELADAVIRIGDLAGAYDMDLGGAIAEKLAYNAQHADHKIEVRKQHGGKAY